MAAEVRGGADDSWTESGTGSITWATQPGSGSVLDTQILAAGAANLWYSWDVGAFVQSKWAGNKLVSLLVKPVTEDSSASPSYAFDAKEYGSGVPALAVTLASTAPTVAQTEFFYRYSTDNSNWGDWASAGLGTGSNNILPFTFSQGYGYYEFHSRATDGTGTVEAAPPVAQASVHHGVAPDYWNPTAAIVSLSNLAQTYDGTPRNAGVTTIPPALAYTVTYNGGTTVPVTPGSYAVAVTVTQPGYTGSGSGTLVVSQGSQAISFGPLAPVAVGAPSFNLTANASSGLQVAFVSSDASVATVSGATVTVLGAGTTTITATQPGNSNYLAAAPVSRDLVVSPTPPTVAVPAAPAWMLLGLAALLLAVGAMRLSRLRGTRVS